MKKSKKLDSLLQQAVQEYDAEQTNAALEEPEQKHVFSDRFERRMRILATPAPPSFISKLFSAPSFRAAVVSGSLVAALILLLFATPIRSMLFTGDSNIGTRDENDYGDNNIPELGTSDVEMNTSNASEQNSDNTVTGSSSSGKDASADGNSADGDVAGGKTQGSNDTTASGDSSGPDQTPPEENNDSNANTDSPYTVSSLNDTQNLFIKGSKTIAFSKQFDSFSYEKDKSSCQNAKQNKFKNNTARSDISAGDLIEIALEESAKPFDSVKLAKDDSAKMFRLSLYSSQHFVGNLYLSYEGIVKMLVQ